ncbi:MAG: UbiD family decarboxylase [Pirellulaceae bacterium]|jgi:4-hydroxy-3-polyprenylbenzoate decarboxylase|nr:UbiD family decarboxylase [Thermoguttaceae bacterium]NLZ01581.1 UbiD family decarboxylase [Pirellulaceae bacterium]
MGYRTLRECVEDLERTGQLLRIEQPVDPNLEAAEIQRRVFAAGGPALYFASVRGCRFPMVSNLFGTIQRARYLFRDSLEMLARLVSLSVDPTDLVRRPRLYLNLKTPAAALFARPRKVRRGPVLAIETTLDQLPQLRSWPDDGGAYITLPQVYTEDPDAPGLARANLGMYRIQISGGRYERNEQAGIHYQLHRGIGGHHAAAIRRGERLPLNVFVGGPPAMTVAAVMPLPEGVSELAFAGLLGRRRVPMVCLPHQLPIHAEADFCITGHIEPNRLLPEGPFGDHLGYYSMAHDFPVMRVERVFHRHRPIWPFTVVGRPPQEDSVFNELIHEMVGPIIPKTIPGVRAVHAVDAAGVHPLLLAIGSERYVPYEEPRRVRELLTLANALLGQGQLSLAKYLFIVAGEDNPELDIRHLPDFLRHLLERVDWRRDLHFQTCTTIDTLDYSGEGLNQGSKVVIAAAGSVRRNLPVAIDSRIKMPGEGGFGNPRVVLPGILAVEGPRSKPDEAGRDPAVQRFCLAFNRTDAINGFPLIVVVDNSDFAARSLNNFLWTTFTRSDPAADIFGIDSFVQNKHWGCLGSVVIDARAKIHHAPPLVEDPEVTRRVNELAAKGKPLHGVI